MRLNEVHIEVWYEMLDFALAPGDFVWWLHEVALVNAAGLIDAPITIIHGRVHLTHQLLAINQHHHCIESSTRSKGLLRAGYTTSTNNITSNSAHQHSYYPAPAQQQGKE